MKLKQPAAPFERFEFQGNSINIDTSGKVLVLPSGNPDILPSFNEYTLTEGRTLTAGTYEFTDDTDVNTGLQNLIYPLIALYNQTSSEIDFFLFTHQPKNLSCVVDTGGKITSITLFPGNGQIYHGRITYCNPTLDSDSDLIPDCLKQNLHFTTQDEQTFTTADGSYFDVNTGSQNGSLFKFLEVYGAVI